MPVDAGEIKAKVTITYDGSGVDKAKEDIAKLAESAGGLEESANQGSKGLAGLEEQAQKTAESTQKLNSSIGAIEKPLERSGEAVTSMTEAMQEQRGVIEDTAKSLGNIQEPLKSYNEGLQTISETVGSSHFSENMSAFQDALENPYPFSMVNQYLKETGQTWGDFTTSIGENNTAMLHEMATNSDVTHKVLNTMSSDVQSVGKTFIESADSAEVFTKQFNGLNESVVNTGKALNQFGGVGSVLYGPELPPGGVGKVAGLGDIFGGATEGLMGMLNDIAMPLMAIQMVGMAVLAVGQSIYDSAAIAEGPAAHSFGSFTGTIDALGQSAQRLGSQFSESFGQQILPTLNAVNYQASQANGGGLGGFLGGLVSTVSNLWQLGTGANPVGGIEGFANQGASAMGLPQPFQGPGPLTPYQQYQQQIAQLPQTVQAAALQLQMQSSVTLAEAINPQYLAAQNQLSASQRAAQYLVQSYDISHPQSQYDLIQQARYNAYASQQADNYQYQMANQPTYGQSLLGNIGAGNWGGAWNNLTGASGDRWAQAWQSQGGAFNSVGDFFSAWGNNFMHGGETPYSAAPPDVGGFFGGIGKNISNWWDSLWTPGDSTGITSSGGGCFIAGTLVLMTDGTEKPIETLQIGDKVLAHNGIVTSVLARIFPPPKPVYKLELSDGAFLVLTNSHPISTLDGWKSISPEATALENPGLEVSPLQVGDTIQTVNGTCMLVNMCSLPGIVQVYNITVDSPHTFYANGVLVHNKTLGGNIAQQVADTELPRADWKNSALMQSIVGNFSNADLNHTFTATATWVGQGLSNQFTGVASWIGSGLANTFQGVANWIGSGLSNTFQGVASWIGAGLSNTFQGVANWIGQGLSNTFQGVANWIGQNLNNTFKGVADWVGEGLKNTFKGVADWVGQNLEHTFTGVASWIGQNLSQTFVASASWLPGFASGVRGFSGGYAVVGEQGPELVYLPQGSNVIPNNELSSMSGISGGNGDVVVYITHVVQLDGRTIMKESAPYLATAARQLVGGKR